VLGLSFLGQLFPPVVFLTPAGVPPYSPSQIVFEQFLSGFDGILGYVQFRSGALRRAAFFKDHQE